MNVRNYVKLSENKNMKNLLEPLFYLMLYIKADTYSGVKFLLEVLQFKKHRIQTYSIEKKKQKTKPDDLSN